jgi:group I intron endonuclease
MTLKDSGIYCIEHIATGKKYVGSAHNLHRRFKTHLSKLRGNKHHSYKLQEAWNEYGEGAFKIVVMERHPIDGLLEREQQVIDELDVVRNGYNVAMFSEAPHKGKKHSEETKAKMRASHKARKPISEETRQRLREAAIEREKMKKETGYQVSEETRARLSASGKGRKVSAEHIEKLRSLFTGKPLAEETKRKLSEALKGRKATEETRRKLSEAGYRRWARARGEQLEAA